VSLVLDTHAALWLVQGDSRLGDQARQRIESARSGDLAISDMVLLELAMLIEKRRVVVKVDPAIFLDRLANRFVVVPVNGTIAVEAMSLDLVQGDPFDRVCVATARHLNAELVTRDAAIRQSGLVRVVW
jgi:PIN domain nuclease of toxin-antitoxin system